MARVDVQGAANNVRRARDSVASMVASDTSPAAEATQLEILRKMSRRERLQLALDLSEFVRELERAGIRHAHPEWTEAQITRELLRRSFVPLELPPPLR